MADLDELQFTWSMTSATAGTDDDPLNPFSRALDRLLRDGQPLQKFGLCFTGLPETPGSQLIRYWLGAFVFSAGNRLIFFPGYATAPETFESFRGPSRMALADVGADHLSLERDRTRWHATSPRSQNHFGGPTALPLGAGRVLWFGMSIARPDALRVARTSTVVRASVPETDAVRRADIFRSARDATTFPIVCMNPQANAAEGPSYYHFSVIVGPPDFPEYVGTEHAFPLGSPYVEIPLPAALSQLPVATYRLSLRPHCDVQITAMRLPGALRIPIAVTGPSGPQTLPETENP